MRGAMGRYRCARICVRPGGWVLRAAGLSLLTAWVALVPGARLAQAMETVDSRSPRGRAAEAVRGRLVVPVFLARQLGLHPLDGLHLAEALHATARRTLARAESEHAGSKRGRLFTTLGVRLTNAGLAVEAVQAWATANLSQDIERLGLAAVGDHLGMMLNRHVITSLSASPTPQLHLRSQHIVMADQLELPAPSAQTQQDIASLRKTHAIHDDTLAHGTVAADISLALYPTQQISDASGTGPGAALVGGVSLAGKALQGGQREVNYISVNTRIRDKVD